MKMQRRLPAIAAIAAMAVLAGSAPAAQAAEPAKPGMGLFARPLVLRGTLGERQIQMRLRPKTEYEGVEGDYFRFGESAKVLLAGEADGDEILLEESENGTDVSGQWEGKRIGDAIEGSWQSADGSVSKPFKLTPVEAGADRKSGPSVRQPGNPK